MESLHSRPFQMFAAGGCIWDPASEPLASAALDRLCKLCATCIGQYTSPHYTHICLKAPCTPSICTEVTAASTDRLWQTREHAHPFAH